jgi:transposase-like protein
MKRHRHTPEQIVRKLREGERLLNEGKDLTEVVRHLGIAESTWNRWRSQYGVPHAPGGPGPRCRGLAHRVQHLPAALVSGRPHPHRVRWAVDHQPAGTLIAAGPHNGVPSGGPRGAPPALSLQRISV